MIPTNGELNLAMNNLKEHITENFKDVNEKLDTIGTQVVKTNGRVKNLELWRSFILGAMAILTSIGIPLILYIYHNEKSNAKDIAAMVLEILAKDYDIYNTQN